MINEQHISRIYGENVITMKCIGIENNPIIPCYNTSRHT